MMRFLGIEESNQKLNFRSCAGAELTQFWEKKVMVWFEATEEEGVPVAAHTYKQVMENTNQTLLKLVSKDRAIIKLLRLEVGNKSFIDFLADVEDQTHLCHNWESLTGEDMKRISLFGGLKNRALAEEYMLKQIIQAAVNRESSKANAEALQSRPTRHGNRLDDVEGQQGVGIDARINHLQAELEDVLKLRQVGNYSGRHKGEEEKEQCPR